MSNFSIPPNKSSLLFASKALPPRALMTNLARLGLTAEDFKPIDWRKHGLSPVLNQQQCGNCWAMSSTSCLTDRFMIGKKISDILLQPIVTTLCVSKDFNSNWNSAGCNGGFPEEAVRFFEQYGLPKVGSNCPSPKELIKQTAIQATCGQLKQQCGSVVYKAKPASLRFLTVGGNAVDPQLTIVNIQRELMNGPVIGAFKVFGDFMYFKDGKPYKWDLTNGIYIHGAGYQNDGIDAGQKAFDFDDGGHAIEVVGWDVGEAGSYGRIPYWIIKNSWTSMWMDKGYGKIAMYGQTNANPPRMINHEIFLDVSAPTGNPEYPYQGGMIAFDIDHNSGDRSGYVGEVAADKSFASSKSNQIALIVIFSVLIVFALIYFIRYRRRN